MVKLNELSLYSEKDLRTAYLDGDWESLGKSIYTLAEWWVRKNHIQVGCKDDLEELIQAGSDKAFRALRAPNFKLKEKKLSAYIMDSIRSGISDSLRDNTRFQKNISKYTEHKIDQLRRLSPEQLKDNTGNR